MQRSQFRRRVEERDALLVPLALDPLTARMCDEVGFEAVYLSGGALGYQYAVSEALLTLTELCDVARRICRRSDVPLIVDGGVGFGDPVHMARTIWDVEATGAAAIEIEDQVAPKRVSHHRGVEHMITLEEMVAKIEHAVAARTDPDFLIIARTAGVRNESFDTAIARGRAYAEAGADAILLMPSSEDEWQRTPGLIDVPLVSFAPLGQRTVEEWSTLGWSVILDPFSGQVLAHDTVERAYRTLMSEGDLGVPAREIWAGYGQLADAAGLEELYEIERRTTEPGT